MFYAIILSNSVYVNKFIVYYSVCFYKNILIELHSSSLSLDEFHFHLFAQLFYDLDHIFPKCFVDHFSSVLWCEYHVVFAPVTGMGCVFYFIFHPSKTSLLFRAKSRLVAPRFYLPRLFYPPGLPGGLFA